jgi:hypothetical protein
MGLVVLHVQRHLWWHVHLRLLVLLLLLQRSTVLAQGTLQVEGQRHLAGQGGLWGCRVWQRQQCIILWLQAPWLQLGRQHTALLLLQQLRLGL